MPKIKITPPFIKLEQFLKLCSLVSSGGEAKQKIQSGEVSVNGEACRLRGKKLFGGEKVYVAGETEYFEVELV